MKPLIVLTLFALASPALAQPSPTKLHVDLIFVGDAFYPVDDTSGYMPITVPSGAQIVIAGWMLNCYTGQQPPWVTVFDGHLEAGVTVELPHQQWPRIPRPDVQKAAKDICSGQPKYAVNLPSGPYLGFGVMVGPLEPGHHNIMLRVTDPVAWPTTDTLFGTQYKTIALLVRP